MPATHGLVRAGVVDLSTGMYNYFEEFIEL
jgi:hypothetical protein